MVIFNNFINYCYKIKKNRSHKKTIHNMKYLKIVRFLLYLNNKV